MKVKTGASIYVTAAELEALHEARDHLMGIFAGASDPQAIADLSMGLDGLSSLIDKASKGRRATARRSNLKVALRAAEVDE